MKANSERIVGKNFKNFCGKPLFRWVLDTLVLLEVIDEIVINTDARELLRYHGLTEGGKVVLRDRAPELCGDKVSMNHIIADDIAAVKADIYLMTHTTNPLLSRATIRSALAAFGEGREGGDRDSLFTVNKFQARFYREDGSPVNHDPGNLVPTQQIEPWYEENSNLYIFTQQSFAETHARIGRKPIMFETPSCESLDIDTPGDWDFAVVAQRYIEGCQKECV